MTVRAMHAFLLLLLAAAPQRVTDDQGCSKALDDQGALHGEMVCHFPSGQKRSEGKYEHGKRVGVAKTWRESGKLASVDTFKDGKRHGRCQEYDRDGALEEDCEYKDDKRDGLCKLYGNGGTLREERRYVGGLQRGPWTSYWLNGNVRERGNLDESGKRHGLHERFLEDGSRETSTPFVRGEKDGVERHWLSSGTLRRELTWKAGEQHGLAREFHDSGQLEATLCYQHGELQLGTNACTGKKGPEVVTVFWPRGKPKETYLVRDGKRHGERRLFDKDGDLQLSETWVDGQLDGPQKRFEKKRLLSTAQFKAGQQHGAELRYFEDGKVAEESTWKGGQLVGRVSWWTNGKKRAAEVLEQDLWKRQTWFDNGQLQREYSVLSVRGQEYLNGAERRWSEAGVLLEERSWVSGKPDGLTRLFFSGSGKPFAEEQYRQGKLVARREWSEAGVLVRDEQLNPDGSRREAHHHQ